MAEGRPFGEGYTAGTGAYNDQQDYLANETGRTGVALDALGSIAPILASTPVAAGEQMTPMAIARGNAAYGAVTGGANNADTWEDAATGAGREAVLNGLLGYGLGHVGGMAGTKFPKPQQPSILRRGAGMTGGLVERAGRGLKHPITKTLATGAAAAKGQWYGAAHMPYLLERVGRGVETVGQDLGTMSRASTTPLTAAERAAYLTPQAADALVNPSMARLAVAGLGPAAVNSNENNYYSRPRVVAPYRNPFDEE
jgi:hypothetical protein